ncbi:chemotaxis protein CheX [Aquipuribacter sp. MA13-6]|uniref:chemotaxis protein CheX n=1 Tax=unclassified Aquipuribacter TaxID=2635084 RepID=UPI003EEA05B7
MSVDGEVLAELTQAVWESFVDAELPLVDLYGAPLQTGAEGVVVGTIAIHGPQAGRVNVALPAPAASAAAARMFDIDPSAVAEADVHDATGEIANMIGGNVKAMLAGEHHLGLPSVTVAPTDPYDAVASATLLWGEHTLLVTLDRAPGGTS